MTVLQKSEDGLFPAIAEIVRVRLFRYDVVLAMAFPYQAP